MIQDLKKKNQNTKEISQYYSFEVIFENTEIRLFLFLFDQGPHLPR